MHRIWNLDDDRIDHRQVRCDRYAVVKKTRIFQRALFVIDEFLVERPTDPLYGTALVLAFYIGRMNGTAGVLSGCIADDRSLPCIRVDLHVAEMN